MKTIRDESRFGEQKPRHESTRRTRLARTQLVHTPNRAHHKLVGFLQPACLHQMRDVEQIGEHAQVILVQPVERLERTAARDGVPLGRARITRRRRRLESSEHGAYVVLQTLERVAYALRLAALNEIGHLQNEKENLEQLDLIAVVGLEVLD